MNKREDLFANKKISVFDPCLLAIIVSSGNNCKTQQSNVLVYLLSYFYYIMRLIQSIWVYQAINDGRGLRCQVSSSIITFIKLISLFHERSGEICQILHLIQRTYIYLLQCPFHNVFQNVLSFPCRQARQCCCVRATRPES